MLKSRKQFECLAVAAVLVGLIFPQVAKGEGPFPRRLGSLNGLQQQLQQRLGNNNANQPTLQGNNLKKHHNNQSPPNASGAPVTTGTQGAGNAGQPQRLRKLFKTGAAPFQNGNTGINGGGQPQGTPALTGGGGANAAPKAFDKGNHAHKKSQAGNVTVPPNQSGQGQPIKTFSIPNPVDVASDGLDAAGDVATSVGDRVQKAPGAISDSISDVIGHNYFHSSVPDPNAAPNNTPITGVPLGLPGVGPIGAPAAPVDNRTLRHLGKKKIADSQLDYGGSIHDPPPPASAFPIAGMKLPGMITPSNPGTNGGPSGQGSPNGTGNGTPAPGPAAPAPTGPIAQGGQGSGGGFPFPLPIPVGLPPIFSGGQGGGASVPVESDPAPVVSVPQQPVESAPAAAVPVQYSTARPAAQETASADLVLEDIAPAEPATRLAGPAYHVQFRNQGHAAVGKFRVVLVAGLDGGDVARSPQAAVEVAGLAGGQIGEVTIRLPRTAMRMVSAPNAAPTAFTQLLIEVDPDEAVADSDRSNNSADISRAELEVEAQ